MDRLDQKYPQWGPDVGIHYQLGLPPVLQKISEDIRKRRWHLVTVG